MLPVLAGAGTVQLLQARLRGGHTDVALSSALTLVAELPQRCVCGCCVLSVQWLISRMHSMHICGFLIQGKQDRCRTMPCPSGIGFSTCVTGGTLALSDFDEDAAHFACLCEHWQLRLNSSYACTNRWTHANIHLQATC